MASMILLARLISPAEFGYFAVAIIAQELAIVITAEGIGTALVQRETVDREHLQAGLWLALVTGLVFMRDHARGGRSDRLADLRRAHRRVRPLSSPLFLIAAAGTVPMALLRRRLAFRRLSMIDLGTSVMRVGVAVVLAIAGLEGESLVFGGVAAGLTTTVLAWASAPAPLPRMRLQAAREVISYGLPASIASISWVGFRNCDYAIIGARLGAVQAGYYFRAYNLAVEYQKKISIVMGQVGLPAAGAVRASEMAAMRGHMVRLIAILTFPLLAVLAITAPRARAVAVRLGVEPRRRADADPRGGRRVDAGHRRGRRRAHGLRPPAGAAGFGCRPLRHLRRRRADRHAVRASPGCAAAARSSTRPSWSWPTSSCVRGSDESWVPPVGRRSGRRPCRLAGPGRRPRCSIGLSAAGTPTLVAARRGRAAGSGPTPLTLRPALPGRLRGVLAAGAARAAVGPAPAPPAPPDGGLPVRGATRLRDALQLPRIWKYRALSTCRRVTGKRDRARNRCCCSAAARSRSGATCASAGRPRRSSTPATCHVEAASPRGGDRDRRQRADQQQRLHQERGRRHPHRGARPAGLQRADPRLGLPRPASRSPPGRPAARWRAVAARGERLHRRRARSSRA